MAKFFGIIITTDLYHTDKQFINFMVTDAIF